MFLGRGARHDKKYDDNYKKGKNPFCCPAAIMEKARKVGRGILFNLFQPPPRGGGIPTHNKRRGKGKKVYSFFRAAPNPPHLIAIRAAVCRPVSSISEQTDLHSGRGSAWMRGDRPTYAPVLSCAPNLLSREEEGGERPTSQPAGAHLCPFVRNTRPGFLGRILSLSAAVASIRKRREASTTRSEFLRRKKKTQRTFPFSCTPSFLPAKKHSNFGAEKLLPFFPSPRGQIDSALFFPQVVFFCFAAVSLRQIFFSSSRQQEGSGKRKKEK